MELLMLAKTLNSIQEQLTQSGGILLYTVHLVAINWSLLFLI